MDHAGRAVPMSPGRLRATGVHGVVPSREVVTQHCFHLVGFLQLIAADGTSMWSGAESVLILLPFSFPSPLKGGKAACTSAAGSLWTMSHGRCASLAFSHGILPLINPFDFSLFEAQDLDVFQHTLKSDMKTLQPVQKFKPLV